MNPSFLSADLHPEIRFGREPGQAYCIPTARVVEEVNQGGVTSRQYWTATSGHPPISGLGANFVIDPSPATPIKILLVDDEAYFRVFVGKVLRKTINCTVTEARNGREAVAECRMVDPDLIILDINMPQMDGVQALAAIRAIKPDTPVIMLTSIAEEKVVEECIAQRASYFIRKDVGGDTLQKELQEMLRTFVGPEGDAHEPA